ncbi:unnamed protein product [Linum trigynum]|uniref:Secreted protein n=1 Tax=Linum trigynum TaxID=586398 RepID=A0AAV2GG71_9ROSI
MAACSALPALPCASTLVMASSQQISLPTNSHAHYEEQVAATRQSPVVADAPPASNAPSRSNAPAEGPAAAAPNALDKSLNYCAP